MIYPFICSENQRLIKIQKNQNICSNDDDADQGRDLALLKLNTVIPARDAFLGIIRICVNWGKEPIGYSKMAQLKTTFVSKTRNFQQMLSMQNITYLCMSFACAYILHQ